MPTTTHCDPEALLREHGLRKTDPRRAVLSTLMQRSGLWTASRLFEKLEGPQAMDRATVYRVLQDLEGAGIARRVIDAGVDYFEIDCLHNPVHPHFKCLTCGGLECLAALRPGEVKALSKHAGPRSLTSLAVTLSGVCRVCAKKDH